LKTCLENLAKEYDWRYLDSDPLGIAHRYESDTDMETAGFIASFLAYGNAAAIRNSAVKALSPAGESPSDFAVNIRKEKAMECFSNFKHRWTDGAIISGIFLSIGHIYREYGSLGNFLKEIDNSGDKNIENTLNGFSGIFNDLFNKYMPESKSKKIIPAPSGGSACKRLCMYFRWMVRGPDGTDFGIWNFIYPSRLIIPVDRHIARMASLLGLSDRKNADWKMALEITENLKKLDPDDPVRFDFALTRPGILGECGKSFQRGCINCILKECCRKIP